MQPLITEQALLPRSQMKQRPHGFKKAFVCSDPDLIKFNVTSKVTDILTANGLRL